MDQAQIKKVSLLAGVIVAAVVAIIFAYNRSVASPQIEVVGSLPQASKEQEMEAAKAAAQAGQPNAQGVDPADITGGKQ